MAADFPRAAFATTAEPVGLVNTTALNIRSCLCMLLALFYFKEK